MNLPSIPIAITIASETRGIDWPRSLLNLLLGQLPDVEKSGVWLVVRDEELGTELARLPARDVLDARAKRDALVLRTSGLSASELRSLGDVGWFRLANSLPSRGGPKD